MKGIIMSKDQNIESILKLNKLVFDKIEFERQGFKNDKALELKIQSNISYRKDTEVYKVSLEIKGNKPEEYIFDIILSGFFSIEVDGDLAEDLKNSLITKNSVAILMPYLRSEVSLLTAQPNTECVVLPPFNINSMFEDK